MSRLSSPYLAAVLAIGAAAILPATAAHADGYGRGNGYGANEDVYVVHQRESCRDRRDDNTAGGAVTGAIVGGAAAAVPGAVVGAVIGGSIGNSATHCGYDRDRYAYNNGDYDYNYDNDRHYRDHYRRDDYGYRSDGYYGYDRRDPYYGDRRHSDRDGW